MPRKSRKLEVENRFGSSDPIIIEALTNAERSTPGMSPIALMRIRVAGEICDPIFELLKTASKDYLFDLSLSEAFTSIVIQKNLDIDTADYVFFVFEKKLLSERQKHKEMSSNYVNLGISIESFERTAVNYFWNILEKEFKDLHVAEIVSRTELILERYGPLSRFYREAAKRSRASAEKKIARGKKEVEIRQALKPLEELNALDVLPRAIATPMENLNVRYKELVGRSLEELHTETIERFSKHKELLLQYLEKPDEIRAYLDANRFDSALALAVSDVETILHSEKDERGRYKTPHKEYCQLFSSYVKKYFDWDNLQQYLRSLNDTKTKFIYLVCLKTVIEIQKTKVFRFDHNHNLSELCGFELSKLEAQLLSEQGEEQGSDESSSVIKNSRGQVRDQHPGLTQDRAILFLNYLFNALGAENNNTSKAKVISVLTSYNEEKIRQRLSSIFQKDGRSGKTYRNDVAFVRELATSLGLTDIRDLIDRETEM